MGANSGRRFYVTGRAGRADAWSAWTTALIVAISLLSSLDPIAAERYAQVVYPALTKLVAPLHATVPGSSTLVAMLLLLAGFTVWSWRRRPGRVAAVAVLMGLAAILWGLASWGVHYRRPPVAERWSMASTATASEVDALRHLLVETVEATAPEDGISAAEADAAIAAVARTLEELGRRLDGWDAALPDHVVSLPPGSLLTFGASGIVSPWWLEAHVDGALPPAARISVAAHELAHLAGHAREDEAEALGAWAALRTEDANARYAAALFQLARFAWSLPDAERRALLASLPERARIDLREAADAVDRYGHPLITRLSRGIYDRYLRAQGVDEGIRSYADATDLLARLAAAGR